MEYDESTGGSHFEFALFLFFYGIGLGPYAGFVGDDGNDCLFYLLFLMNFLH